LTLSSSNAQNVTSSPESSINITGVTSTVPLPTTSVHPNSSLSPATVSHAYQLPPPSMSTAISAVVLLVSSTIAVSPRHSAAQHTERMPGVELEDQYINGALRYGYFELMPTFTNFNDPLVSLYRPSRNFPTTTTTMAGQDTSGIEAWAQALASPPNPSRYNLVPTFLSDYNAPSRPQQDIPQPNRQTQQPSLPISGQHAASYMPSANVTFPPFWESNVELWFSTAEHLVSANGILTNINVFL